MQIVLTRQEAEQLIEVLVLGYKNDKAPIQAASVTIAFINKVNAALQVPE